MGQVGRDASGSLLESRSLLLTALRDLGDTPGGTGVAGKGEATGRLELARGRHAQLLQLLWLKGTFQKAWARPPPSSEASEPDDPLISPGTEQGAAWRNSLFPEASRPPHDCQATEHVGDAGGIQLKPRVRGEGPQGGGGSRSP